MIGQDWHELGSDWSIERNRERKGGGDVEMEGLMGGIMEGAMPRRRVLTSTAYKGLGSYVMKMGSQGSVAR